MIEEKHTVDINEINEKIEKESAFVDLLTLEINKVIVGQKQMVERLLIGLLARDIYCWKAFQDWQKHWR